MISNNKAIQSMAIDIRESGEHEQFQKVSQAFMLNRNLTHMDLCTSEPLDPLQLHLLLIVKANKFI